MGRKRREFTDLTGQQFGRWTVLGLADPKKDASGREYEMWKCQCGCDNHTVKDIYVQHLIHGNSKSCGCLLRETAGNNFRTHGKTETRLYNIWCGMKARCRRKSNPAYKRYGGRGIDVCAEWNDFKNFSEWAESHGYADDLSIDRIDNSRGYSPDNCRWVTAKAQANNTRSTRMITIDGVTKCAAEWSEIYGVPLYEIHFRIRNGWDPDRAVKTPLIKYERITS